MNVKSINGESFKPKNTRVKFKKKEKQIFLCEYFELLHMKNIKRQTINCVIKTKGLYL